MKQSLLTNDYLYLDYRERKLLELLKNKTRVFVGNYPVDAIVKGIAVERKTGRDFEASIIDDRLFQQLQVLKEYDKRVLVVEGDFEGRLSPKHYYGALSSLVQHGISLIKTQSIQETAEFLLSLMKEHKGESKIYIAEKKSNPQLATLAGIPGVGKKRALKLLEHFGTLKGVFSSDLEDLKKVLGPKLGEKVYKFINTKYEHW